MVPLRPSGLITTASGFCGTAPGAAERGHETARASRPQGSQLRRSRRRNRQAPGVKPAPQSQLSSRSRSSPIRATSTRAAWRGTSSTVLSDRARRARAIVGSTSPTGVAKVDADGHGGFRHRHARFARRQRQVRSRTGRSARPWSRGSRRRRSRSIAPKRRQVDQRPSGQVGEFRRPRQRDRHQRKAPVFPARDYRSIRIYEPLTDGLAALSAGQARARSSCSAARRRTRSTASATTADIHLVAIPWSTALEQSIRAGARRRRRPSESRPGERHGRDRRPNRWRSSRSTRRPARRAPTRSAAWRAPSSTSYDAFLGDDRDAHWRDVNLAADPSSPNAAWPRLAAAQGWLDEHKTSADASLDAFRASAKGGRRQRRPESRGFRSALRRPDALAQPDAIEEDAPCPFIGNSSPA